MKHPKRILVTALVICLFVLGAGAAVFVSVGAADPFTEAGAGFSLAFDRQQMRSVDRAVVIDHGKNAQVEITDSQLISALVAETMAATHVDVGCPDDRTILLYSGELLIRSMQWQGCCDTVRVYSADGSHWIWSVEGGKSEGYVYLSNDLVRKIDMLFLTASAGEAL